MDIGSSGVEDDEEVEGVSEREGLRLAAEDEDGRDEDGGGEDDERVDRRAHYRHVRANLWAVISPVVVGVVELVQVVVVVGQDVVGKQDERPQHPGLRRLGQSTYH